VRKIMIDIRTFDSLGAANHGWLDARHHFSFANYHDPARMGWGNIRVWNDDTIAPGAGFAPHNHSDMEIITYVRSGAITHKDSLGNIGRTEAGDVQVMGAGSGVTHSEYNLEPQETTLFQIWVHPRAPGGEPHWGMQKFPKSDRAGNWVVLASGYDDAGALNINADARVYGATLAAEAALDYSVAEGSSAYLVVSEGMIVINGVTVNPRDGVALGLGDYAINTDAGAQLVMVETNSL
jgi:quercetin 2,3-dioxygenase